MSTTPGSYRDRAEIAASRAAQWTLNLPRREFDNASRWLVMRVREWADRHYTPFPGERIDACMGQDRCVVEIVDIRGDLVIDTDGRRHSLRYCVDPYGWRDAYVAVPDEDGAS